MQKTHTGQGGLCQVLDWNMLISMYMLPCRIILLNVLQLETLLAMQMSKLLLTQHEKLNLRVRKDGVKNA